MVQTPRDLLEQDLVDFPDERGEILLEIAHEHVHEGDGDSAVKIWRELIDAGGEDGDYARAELAGWLFETGDDSAARAELATLKAARQTDRGAWEMAAELFEERGELGEAHEWFTMATTRLTQADLLNAAADFGWASSPGQLIRARRRVRTAIGLPLDETDQLVPAEEVIRSMAREPDQPAVGAHTARMLFWPRPNYSMFQQRWPNDEGAAMGAVEYYRGLQRNLEQLADDGAAQVLAVPADVSDYTDELVADAMARRRYLNDRIGAGVGISWPPGRNEPCWCGSGTKYKKCCARPVG